MSVLDGIMKEQFKKQAKAAAMIHLTSRQQELVELLNDIKESDLTTASQIIGLIQNNLERIEEIIKEQE